jgi:type IV secretory pathway TrbD component
MEELLTAPVYRALLSPPMIMGVPQKLFIFTALFTAVMVLSLSQWWFIAFAILILIVGREMAKADNYFFDFALYTLRTPEVMD